MTLSNQTNPLTTLQILREALKLITKNYNLILPILLLNLLTSTLLFYLNHLTLTSIISNITATSLAATAFAASPQISQLNQLFSTIRKDIRWLILIEAAFLITSFVIQSLLSLAIIHVLSVAHSGSLPTLEDLLSKLRRAWKGPLITMLYVNFFSFSYTFLVLVPIYIYLLLSYYDSFLWTAFGAIVALFPLSLFVYLATAWSVSVVVSVVDEGCYGLGAIAKATEIVDGKRLRGVLILLSELVMVGVPSYAYGHAAMRLLAAVRLALGVVQVGLVVVVHVCILAAITVYYHECKRSHGETSEVAMDGGLAYSSLRSTASLVDEASLKVQV